MGNRRHWDSHAFISMFYSIMLFLLMFMVMVEAPAPARRTTGSAARRGKMDADPFTGIIIIPIIFAFLFLTPLCYFFYNFARDPATPTLLTNVKDLLIERTFGYLSIDRKKKQSRPAPLRGGEDEFDNGDHED